MTAIARVQTATAILGAPAASLGVTFTGGAPTNGNTLVMMITIKGTSQDPAVASITQAGANWVQAVQSTLDTGNTTRTLIWYAQNVSGAPTLATINFNAAFPSRATAYLVEYAGLKAAGAVLDQVASNTFSVATLSTTSGITLSISRPNELAVVVFGNGTGIGFSGPAMPGATIGQLFVAGHRSGAADFQLDSGPASSSTGWASPDTSTAAIATFFGEEVTPQAVSDIEVDGDASPTRQTSAVAQSNITVSAQSNSAIVLVPPPTVGGLQAMVDAVAESDNEIGSLFLTRLTAALAQSTPVTATLIWDGTTTILTGDTSEVVPGEFVRLATDGQFFEIDSIVPNTSIDILNLNGLTIPTGPIIAALVQTFTWDGTTVVTVPDTSEVGPGNWIRLDSDNQFFQIASVQTNVSVTIENPLGLTIPSDATPSSKSENPRSEKAVTSLPVETTFEWDESGKVAVDGIVYRYASKTLESLDGVTHLFAGRTIPGLRQAHRIQSTVIDLNQSRSDIDKLRQAMLVDFAEDDELSAVGRNLSVLRLPFLSGDAQYRAIIKALAYNPRGTFFGIELALGGIVGEGNFEITEDLVNSPNTVFIKLLAAAALTTLSQGKAFLQGRVSRPLLTDTTLALVTSQPDPITGLHVASEPVDRGIVGSAILKNEDVFTDVRTTKPSTQVITEFPGDPGTTVWAYVGLNEAADIVNSGFGPEDGTLLWTGVQGLYRHEFRALSASEVRVEAQLTFLGTPDPLFVQQGIRFADGARDIRALIGRPIVDATWYVGLGDSGGFVSSFVQVDVFGAGAKHHNIAIRKKPVDPDFGFPDGVDVVELLVDGIVVQQERHDAFAASVEHRIEVGYFGAPVGIAQLSAKHFAFYSRTFQDFWNARGSAGDVGPALPVRQLDVNIVSFFIDPDDVGKRVGIVSSTATNPQGGDNTGSFEIESVDTDERATLDGPLRENATFQTAFPDRVVIPSNGPLFRFPQDLGKEIVIPLSSSENDGSFVITKLLEPGTFKDLELDLVVVGDGLAVNPQPATTNIAEVSGAPPFTTETGVQYRLRPVFVTEASVDWRLSDAGAQAGSAVTLRQGVPTMGTAQRILDVLFSEVLSAQILLDKDVVNQLIQELPDLIFSHYPFYISDPLAFVKQYLDDITAAGVIPELSTE